MALLILALLQRIFLMSSLMLLLVVLIFFLVFFFSSRRRHTSLQGDWSSDVCSSDLEAVFEHVHLAPAAALQERSAGHLEHVGAAVEHEPHGDALVLAQPFRRLIPERDRKSVV